MNKRTFSVAWSHSPCAGGPAPVDKVTLTRQCREALQKLGLPQEAVEMMMALRDKGRAPEDPEGLASKVRRSLFERWVRA